MTVLRILGRPGPKVIVELEDGDYVLPPTESIADGATAPDPGTEGAIVWSTYEGCWMRWDGSAWQASNGETVPIQYAVQIDDVGGGVTYIGEALPGATSTDATWRIKRLTETGADSVLEWAEGNATFDNVWDDRASLSYL